jgi:hypothetical protein
MSLSQLRIVAPTGARRVGVVHFLFESEPFDASEDEAVKDAVLVSIAGGVGATVPGSDSVNEQIELGASHELGIFVVADAPPPFVCGDRGRHDGK